MTLEGIVALVTGGASGLGAATVRTLVEGGAGAAILDRPQSEGDGFARSLGARALFAAADVTKAADVEQAIAHTIDTFGALHVAVNCAGVGTAMRTLTKAGPMPLEMFAKAVEINLIGTFNVIRLADGRVQERAHEGDLKFERARHEASHG